MCDYFRPWRRKFGVVALGLACLFEVVWVRSSDREEELWCCCVDRGRISASWTDGHILCSLIMGQPTESVGWTSRYFEPIDIVMTRLSGSTTRARISVQASHFVIISRRGDFYIHGLLIPLWSIVIPLAFLSAWLLLSKPRKSTPTKPTELIPERAN